MGANNGILHLAFNCWVYFDLHTFCLRSKTYYHLLLTKYDPDADINSADFWYTVTELAPANKLKCTCLYHA